ncbi:SMP-30/gluconolactonase/LRE family protein [Bordetella genomosp. 7]|uniref:Calcium-binding protein n=1 Tax=Bordetella genomosp. 7 TaxID=1416805 RepID=A0A261QYF4_9BORD|nr:SMP-30/gluconolactonase/LRE family protein [Bordetella genomosp. 7]OZI17809.1 calcium-binding protein [Bordetella genomosp. 7]
MRIEILVDVKTTLGESPLWDVDEQRLYWIDGTEGRVFRCTEGGAEVRAWQAPQPIGSMALRERGGALLALAGGFYFMDLACGEIDLVADPEPGAESNRLNDGKVDRQGRFLAGSMDIGETQPTGALYRLDPDLSVHRLDSGMVVSNGPCWSPDGATLYFNDSARGEIRAYDYDPASGAVSNRRIHVRVDPSVGGAPDGSTVDAEGCLWSARVCQGKVVRHCPDGSVDRVIDMPVKNVTSVMFGGPSLDVLYVTSMGRPAQPHMPRDGAARGSVFAIYGLGVQGLPERRFAG